MRFAFSRACSGSVPSTSEASPAVCSISEHLNAFLSSLFRIKPLVIS